MTSSSGYEPHNTNNIQEFIDLEKKDPEYKLYEEEQETDSLPINNPDEDNFEYTEEKKLPFFIRWSLKLNAETKGIEPITDEEKTDNSVIGAASMWFSANMVLASFTLGVIGIPIFGLNFGASVLTIIFFSILGMLPVAYFSVFGAELGLRQMVLSRYLLGNITARIFCLVNCIACVGWGSVNTIASAQLLYMVNKPHSCPPWAGCLIICVGTIMVTFFGYKVIHTYEKWSWIPNFAVFLVIIARLRKLDTFENGPWGGGPTTAGGVLSFGGSIFGFAAGWTTYAADYTVYMPRTINKPKLFCSLVVGLLTPLIFTLVLGAAAAACIANSPKLTSLYNEYGNGGLIFGILAEDSLHGFGQFCCVILAMSTIANNIPNMYSIALGAQSFWEPLSKVPRPFWTIAGNGITIGISIAAYYAFTNFMSSFMSAIAYYLGIYIAISMSEHLIFRKNSFSNYNVDDWNRWDKLPVGYAGTFALIAGGFGVALGMSETYWNGQIGRLIGEYGGDIGFEMGFGWALVIYLIFRPLEIKYTGR
ncbi:cytosine permease SCDLUD_000350 [Saccharomycodes ludwigii]|uniref:cytosine permease n=1 Tax=Saccharomycodes ludwigii TaxID=36035 RepID=UPI001E882D7E|nr:hypothetical protein SCDLUD_000350 [Saccharomycodes ludwigii]KAH3902761.1 hypothetical protein SCDLUD_000350 [Saccharomycodes ludwigii]